MDIMNCPRCGKLFTRINKPICENCLKEEEDIFQSVRKYINDNPNCTLAQVSRDVGVSSKKIMKYLRDGRLEISSGMQGVLTCKKCNTAIKKGVFCESCVVSINDEVSDVFNVPKYGAPKPNDSKKPRMHTKDKRYH